MTPKRPSDRTFGLVFAGLFGGITLIGWLLAGRVAHWAAALCGLLLVAALLAPGLLMPLNRLWTVLGGRIALLVNHLLLGGFFYVVILPFGLAGRLRGGGWMRKRPDPDAETYWAPVQRQATPETYPDLF